MSYVETREEFSAQLKDERWRPYQERFSSLPIFCFNDLKYPDSYDEALLQVSRLDLEQKNIQGQFNERELEFSSRTLLKELEEKEAYTEWQIKARRAQRMKFSQIRILESWMLDFPPNHEERIRALESRAKRVEDWLSTIGYSIATELEEVEVDL